MQLSSRFKKYSKIPLTSGLTGRMWQKRCSETTELQE
ncbi:MAG: hypothetical protein MZV63_59960 [Marinilabiliales bacterium]|nr:hypothetical protein [Marinilabiliales bacterium]